MPTSTPDIRRRASARPVAPRVNGWRVTVARSLAEIDELLPAWQRLRGWHVGADPEHFATVLRHRPEAVRPHVVLLEHDGEAKALALGRIEDVKLAARIGYRKVAAPRVRMLQLVYGGYLGDTSEEVTRRMLAELQAALRRGEADVLRLRMLEVDSPLHRLAVAVSSPLRRERFRHASAHWQLTIPASFEELLSARSASVRRNVRYYGKRLANEFGDRLSVEVFRDGSELERLLRDTRRVAEKTYQHALGAASADGPVERAVTELAIRRRWFRAYVLSIDGEPVAFWYALVVKGVVQTGSTGYDPAYRDRRVGTYLLARMLEDACADPEVALVDYGFGDAEYKRHFGDRSHLEEDVLIYALSWKGLRTNLVRTAVGATTALARWALRHGSAAARVKRRWRDLLRPKRSPE